MIKKIDHTVITTKNVDACLDFYERAGFTIKQGNGRYELFAGDFKINVHILGSELTPHAGNVQPGSADLCFEVDSVEKTKEFLENSEIEIELGIVSRTGVKGPMRSVYTRDPDNNLLEFSSYE